MEDKQFIPFHGSADFDKVIEFQRQLNNQLELLCGSFELYIDPRVREAINA